MMRGAALLCALLGPCGGLKLDRQASQPKEEPKLGSIASQILGAIGNQITKVETKTNSTFKLDGDSQWSSQAAASFLFYKMDVQSNVGSAWSGYWCIEELKFYGSDDARIATDPSMGSAQTVLSAGQDAGMAFNELTDADASYYCSQGGVSTGWLQYQFATPTVVSAYEVERLNGFSNNYSPVSWTLQGSSDGIVWTTLDTQADHSTWSDGEVKRFELQAPASATGDPHLQNIHGERFDLMRPGQVVLINIPRGGPVDSALFAVQADARRLGGQCADLYFQTVNVTGAWADEVRAGGMTFTAAEARDEMPQIAGWTSFGPLKLKVARGHTSQGIKYLNVYVKNLMHTEAAVGGLLGEDDYTEVTKPDVMCQKSMSLTKSTSSAWPGQHQQQPGEHSLAMANINNTKHINRADPFGHQSTFDGVPVFDRDPEGFHTQNNIS